MCIVWLTCSDPGDVGGDGAPAAIGGGHALVVCLVDVGGEGGDGKRPEDKRGAAIAVVLEVEEPWDGLDATATATEAHVPRDRDRLKKIGDSIEA